MNVYIVTNKITRLKHFVSAQSKYHAIEIVKSRKENNQFNNSDYVAQKQQL